MKIFSTCHYIFFAISCFFITFDSLGATQKTNDVAQVAAVAVDKPPSPVEVEVLLLKEQNKILLDHQANLLAVITWSLGSIVTVGVLLVGFGWWANFKFHEGDKTELRRELNATISELDAAARNRVDSELLDQKRLIDQLIERRISTFRTENISLTNSYLADNERLAKRIDGVTEVSDNLQKKVTEIEEGIGNGELQLRMVEERLWDTRGVPINMLVTQTQALAAARKINNLAYIPMVLSRVIDGLKENYIDSARGMEKTDYDRLLPKFKQYEDIDAVSVNEVYRLFAEIKVIPDREGRHR